MNTKIFTTKMIIFKLIASALILNIFACDDNFNNIIQKETQPDIPQKSDVFLLPGNNGIISVFGIDSTSIQISWEDAIIMNENSSGLFYEVYISCTNNLTSNSTIRLDGDLIASGENLNYATATGLDPQTVYYLNVIVTLKSDNIETLYSPVSVMTENEKIPTVNFASAKSNGLENITSVDIPVQLSHSTIFDVVVNYTVTAITATGEGTDFTLANGQVTILAGYTTANINFTVNNDLLDEDNETLKISLIKVSSDNATIGDLDSHTYTIIDDDNPPEISFQSAISSTGDESSTLRYINVILSSASEKIITIIVTDTGYGSAINGTDYTLTNSSPETLTFLPGDTIKSISFTPIEDFIKEGSGETIIFNLSSATNATLVSPTSHEVTITDDDGIPGAIHMFATAISQGNFGGRSGADRLCADTKTNEFDNHFETNIRAFISIDSSDYIEAMILNYTIPGNYEILGPTGIKIADNWVDLLDGTIINSLSDADVIYTDGWWSGSNSDGTSSSINCNGWTTTSETGTAGTFNSNEADWINKNNINCSSSRHVLCISW